LESVEDLCINAQPSFVFCATPTGSVGSPREILANAASQCYDCQPGFGQSLGAPTKLKSTAPSFQPVQEDSQMDAITSCIQLALSSCGKIHDIVNEPGLNGASSTLLTAKLNSGLNAASSYEVVQLAKQSVSAITSRIGTMSLLSARVQKEDTGYSLRCSIACVPDHAKDKMCWDMFRGGRCPRRSTCRWYHPQACDNIKVKVSIRYSEKASEVVSEDKFGPSSSTKKHKISLGELVQ